MDFCEGNESPEKIDRNIYGLTRSQYSQLAIDTFEQIEHFALFLLPDLWGRDTTVLQAQVSSLVFSRQMAGKKTNVMKIVGLTGIPRTTVQNAVDRLIDQKWLTSSVDPDDGRIKLLTVSMAKLDHVGVVEELLVQERLSAFHRVLEMPGFRDVFENSGERNNT